ncbi:MAG TPA: class I SAM-dependent methyltransferase [Firmicutes bacterium]|jgi:ubiquinone/menaquinone biosynthesis C-methylase UbiE|nr:class I SAM-dependent methyltransferase [Bacillota bacterium]
MVRPRIKETDNGIQGSFDIRVFDKMRRKMRDSNHLDTDHLIKSGIDHGLALEIGPGPGYLGLEWLHKTNDTTLKAVEISQGMIHLAEHNADEYNLRDRVTYIPGDAKDLPFKDGGFDAVFSSGSLHEWAEPLRIFNEIYRVLKSGGKYYISDLRRDLNPIIKFLIVKSTESREIIPRFITSLQAAYTKKELEIIIAESMLKEAIIKNNPVDLEITGLKK